jgi:hypothetical protein
MSNSIAAAKRRRAGITETAPPPPQQQQQQQNGMNSGNGTIPARLTFQQVISMLDARLIKLESGGDRPTSIVEGSDETNVSISEYIAEMDSKFSMLVEEITNLKDIVMKLQSYTMDVNKMLTEERIHIMSEFAAKDGQNTRLEVSTQELKEEDAIEIETAV